jgi:hypothetical protein
MLPTSIPARAASILAERTSLSERCRPFIENADGNAEGRPRI